MLRKVLKNAECMCCSDRRKLFFDKWIKFPLQQFFFKERACALLALDFNFRIKQLDCVPTNYVVSSFPTLKFNCYFSLYLYTLFTKEFHKIKFVDLGWFVYETMHINLRKCIVFFALHYVFHLACIWIVYLWQSVCTCFLLLWAFQGKNNCKSALSGWRNFTQNNHASQFNSNSIMLALWYYMPRKIIITSLGISSLIVWNRMKRKKV